MDREWNELRGKQPEWPKPSDVPGKKTPERKDFEWEPTKPAVDPPEQWPEPRPKPDKGDA